LFIKIKRQSIIFFRVGTGLDSQILGDFEIISQIRSSFTQSKAMGLANNFMERLVNAVIQASKKNQKMILRLALELLRLFCSGSVHHEEC
jgi:hypothetical protein